MSKSSARTSRKSRSWAYHLLLPFLDMQIGLPGKDDDELRRRIEELRRKLEEERKKREQEQRAKDEE